MVAARGHAVAAHGAGPAAQGQAEQALNGALSNFFAVAEQYPNLKANQNFVALQQQMVELRQVPEEGLLRGRRPDRACGAVARGRVRRDNADPAPRPAGH